MAPSDIGSIFGVLIGVGALVFSSTQFAGAKMTRFIAASSLFFTLIVAAWACFALSANLSISEFWKYGALYCVFFIALFLDRAARKEDAESKLKDMPKLIEQAKKDGIDIGQNDALYDKLQYAKVVRQDNARTNAIDSLMQLANNSPQAVAIVEKMQKDIVDAEKIARNDVANRLSQIMPSNQIP